MRAIALACGVAAMAVGCAAPFASGIRADHARQFGCEERWVRVDETARGRYRAVGCGFASEWTCRDRQCRMSDHRAYGTDAP